MTEEDIKKAIEQSAIDGQVSILSILLEMYKKARDVAHGGAVLTIDQVIDQLETCRTRLIIGKIEEANRIEEEVRYLSNKVAMLRAQGVLPIDLFAYNKDIDVLRGKLRDLG
ncbi:hypothetical protein ACWX0P_29175 [Vibrio mediterranei]